jgi:hypothetical protein
MVATWRTDQSMFGTRDVMRSIFRCPHATVDIAFTCEAATLAVVGIMGVLITMWGIVMVLVAKPRDLSRTGRMRDVDG